MPPKRDYPTFINPNGSMSNSHSPTKVQVDRWHDAGMKYPHPEPGESQYFYTQRLSRELKAAMKNNPDMFKSRLAPAAAPKQRVAAPAKSQAQATAPPKKVGFTIPHKEAARTGNFSVKGLRQGTGYAMLLGMKTLNDRSRTGR